MTISRRDLLAGSTLALTAALPLKGVSATNAVNKLDSASGESLALARYVERTRFKDLPATVIAATKRSILDAIGVSLAASGLEPACKPFLDLAIESGGRREAMVLGTGRHVPLVAAALANGSLAHAMDYEDAHEETRTHPNAAAIAAALPLCERLNSSGEEFIVAVALGCDVVCRLARALVSDGAPPPGFYQPAIVGTFGATTAAAKLLGLNAEQILDAWSLALCQNSCSAELQNSPESEIRAVREGPCARVGLESALLAAKGVRGFKMPFEGESGFFSMYAQGVKRASLTDKLGAEFGGRDVSFKAWPSCRDTHVYVQAALEVLTAHQIDPNQIASIVATVTPKQMIVCEPADSKRRPQNAITAKFSLFYTLAVTLIDKRVEFSSFSETTLQRPDVLALADKVSYTIVPSIKEGHVLEIRMRDGTLYLQSVVAVYGSPSAPLSDEMLKKKFVDCGVQAMRPRNTIELEGAASSIMTLEKLETLRPLLRRL